MARLNNGLAALLTVSAILWIVIGNLFPQFAGGAIGRIFDEQYAAFLLMFALPMVYFSFGFDGRCRIDESGNLGNVPWLDLILGVIGFIAALYAAVFFPGVSEAISRPTFVPTVTGAILLLLVIDALRRSSGWGITVIVVGFILLALVGHLLPQDISGRHVQYDRFAYFLVWDSSAMLGLPMQIITTVVIAFVLFGTVLFRIGGGDFFTSISMTAMGRFRGGQGKIAVLASSLFGSISGSVVANIVTTGVLTIPMMKNAGFRPKTAGAIEAVASTGGQLLPPLMGVAAFLMAEFLSVSYATVALAAVIPAVLFYIAIFIQVDLEAARHNLLGLPRSELPTLGPILVGGWYYILPFIVLIVSLFVWNIPPEAAAMAAVAVLVAILILRSVRSKVMTWAECFGILSETGHTMAGLIMIGAGAGMVIAMLNYTGIGFGLALALVKIAGGNLFILLVLAAIASIILGMGLPTVGVYVLLATLVAPALIQMGVDPIAAHLFLLYFGCLSMITPPVAIGAFAAANLAKAPPMATGLEAMRMGWMIFVIPFLFIFSDTLLMRESVWSILIDFGAAVLGIWMVSAGITGYLFDRLSVLSRTIAVGAGACLILPAGAFGGAHLINLTGFVAFIVFIVGMTVSGRHAGHTVSPPKTER